MCEQGHLGTNTGLGEALWAEGIPKEWLSLLSQVGQNLRPQNGPSWGWEAPKPQADTICFTERVTKAQSD